MTRWPRAESLETERLDLEPLGVHHAAEMTAVLATPELYAFTGGEAPTAAGLRRRYEAQARGQAPDGSAGWLNWIVRVRATGAAAGFVQATVTERGGHREADIAWLIAPEQQRAGLATEASAAMIGWLRGRGITALRACIHPNHLASARVAARVGLAPTSELEDGEVVWVAASRAIEGAPR